MQQVKDILELISFACAPILAILAFFGLKQIKEARNQVVESKKSRVLSAKRDAFKVAAEKCTYYMENIIPLIDVFNDKIRKEKIEIFNNPNITITSDNITLTPNFTSQDIEKMIDLNMIGVLNAIEAFAMFFVSGVADENVGFLTVGHTYCFTVKRYLPVVVYLSENGKHYSNSIKLFLIWNSRIEKDRLENEKNKIDNELSKNKKITIKPIGTEEE